MREKKEKKEENNLFYGLLLFVLVLLLIFALNSERQNRVCFENKCFNVELAIQNEEQKLGLMFRENLGRSKGMLFIFEEESRYGIWMKNMLFPLDIIWINENQEIIFMARNMQLCVETCRTIMPDKKAKYVLEINAGTIEKLDINLRDRLEFYIDL